MRALILAAGRGSRMGSLTDTLPKSYLALGNRPLLAQQLEVLRQAGINEIAVVTGYCAERLTEFEFDCFFHNPYWSTTNMGTSLWYAAEWLNKKETLITYADILYPVPLVQELKASHADFVLPIFNGWRELWEARFRDPLSDLETLRLHPDGLLAEIGNQAKSYQDIQGQFMGLIRTNPHGWSKMLDFWEDLSAESQSKLDMTTWLNGLVKQGIAIQTLMTAGPWLEIDTQTDWALYQDNWAQKRVDFGLN